MPGPAVSACRCMADALPVFANVKINSPIFNIAPSEPRLISFSMSKKVLNDAFGDDLPQGVTRRLDGNGHQEKYTVWKMQQDKTSG